MRIRDIKIVLRLNIIITGIIALAFGSLSISLILKERASSIEDTREQMNKQVH